VTTTLNYGPFDAEHRLAVRLHFDHRVYDGMTAARALAEIEEILTTEIVAELQKTG
jgi:pyruvate/2-oxoglutarate dehydrogenase complex dihydrolipoamide acyltransferase (E2) component